MGAGDGGHTYGGGVQLQNASAACLQHDGLHVLHQLRGGDGSALVALLLHHHVLQLAQHSLGDTGGARRDERVEGMEVRRRTDMGIDVCRGLEAGLEACRG